MRGLFLAFAPGKPRKGSGSRTEGQDGGEGHGGRNCTMSETNCGPQEKSWNSYRDSLRGLSVRAMNH